MQSTQKTIIGVLVAVAVILGIMIFYKGQDKQAADTTQNGAGNDNKPTTQTNEPPASSFAGLTDQEKKLFTVPGSDATNEEKGAHYEFAFSLAQDTGRITINGCKADPAVLKVQLNKTFKVTNAGNAAIEFGFDKKMNIAAGATVEFKADFKNGAGLYGFGCGDSSIQRPIGFVIVASENK